MAGQPGRLTSGPTVLQCHPTPFRLASPDRRRLVKGKHMGKYQDKWKKAKELFKSTAKVKKPSATVDSFFRKKTGIDASLAKLDLAESKRPMAVPAAYKDFAVAAKMYFTASSSYLKVLQSAVAKVPDKADQESYQRGIKVLQTQLKALDSSVNTALKTHKSALDGRRGMEVMADNLMHLIDSSCNAALAWVARVEAQPTPENFNKSIQKYARDITQNIGNINKLTAKGFKFEKKQPDNLFKVLAAWGNDGRQVPEKATTKEVLREANAFEQAVEGVKKWAA
jgi:hypothetical protein